MGSGGGLLGEERQEAFWTHKEDGTAVVGQEQLKWRD